jgi:hypothetical protein
MKLHEKAKELGVKAKDLITFLNDGGATIKSPNQELTESESNQANKLIELPSSKNHVKGKIFTSVGVSNDNEVVLFRTEVVGEGQMPKVYLLEKRKFPSRAQAFAHIEYLLSLIEMGDFK